MRTSRPGRDYPTSQRDFYDAFGHTDYCWEWLAHLRWGAALRRSSSIRSSASAAFDAKQRLAIPHFTCPECGCEDSWLINHGRRCKGCRRRISALAGTPFHQTKIALPHLVEAAWLMTETSSSINALIYQAMAGTTHENSWAILHKYREVMHAQMTSLELSGAVEVDECFIGGKPRKRWQFTPSGGIKTFSQTSKKHIVLVAIEKRRGGRVVFRRLPSTGAADIMPAVCEIVHNPSTILTDGNPSYNHLRDEGYRHRVFNMTALPLPAHMYLPSIHSAAAHAQQWLSKTIIRTPDAKHLDFYLGEQSFRWNLRRAPHQGFRFYRLMEATVNHAALTQKDIVAHVAA